MHHLPAGSITISFVAWEVQRTSCRGQCIATAVKIASPPGCQHRIPEPATRKGEQTW